MMKKILVWECFGMVYQHQCCCAGRAAVEMLQKLPPPGGANSDRAIIYRGQAVLNN